MAVARVPGRHHAVEHVHAAGDAVDQVLRPAHAHEVARAVRGQLRAGVLEHGVALGLGLAHGQSADGVAVEADVDQAGRRARAQILVHPALHDPEQGRVVALVRFLRALRPAQRQLHRALDHALVDRLAVDLHRRAFVEDHHHVRAQHLLDVHRLLGPDEDLGAVGGRGEGDAGFSDLAAVREREHLEAAGVGEDRPVPAPEAVQAAVGLDHLQPGAQVEVEGVAEDDLRAQLPNLPRQHALDRAVGTHRHEGRRLHRAARKRQPPAPRGAVGGEQVEVHAGHRNPGVGGAAYCRGTAARARALRRSRAFCHGLRGLHGLARIWPRRKPLSLAGPPADERTVGQRPPQPGRKNKSV